MGAAGGASCEPGQSGQTGFLRSADSIRIVQDESKDKENSCQMIVKSRVRKHRKRNETALLMHVRAQEMIDQM